VAAKPGAARPAARPRAKPKGPTRRARFSLWLALLPRHWLAVAVIVAVLIVGIPLAHAMLGDLGALLLLTGIGGFALGRATAKHDIPGTRMRVPRRRAGGE
jgi:hypothetical protein